MAAVPYGIIGYMTAAFPEFMGGLYGNLAGTGVMTICLAVYMSAYYLGLRIIGSMSDLSSYRVYGGGGALLLAADYRRAGEEIQDGIRRNPHGQGSSRETVDVVAGDSGERIPVEIEVGEQKYTDPRSGICLTG